jgi:hypothetical protein
VIQLSLAYRGFPRSASRICSSLDILAAEWGVSRGRRRSPSQKVSWSCLKRFPEGSSQPMPAAKPAAPRSSKASASAKTTASCGSKPPLGGSSKGWELPSPGRRVGDFGTDISVEDYFVGKFFFNLS